jgi:hypothetical protein
LQPAQDVGSSEPGLAEAPPIVDEVLRSAGQPLAEPVRAFMEPRFGREFSRVRVHTDAHAAESARQINSMAYTVGNHIVVGPRGQAPNTEDGQRLFAHELAHVVQQGLGGRPAGVIRRAPGSGGADDQPPKQIRTPVRVEYGSTPISKKAIEYRRNNRGISGDQNLLVVEFSWRRTDDTAPAQDEINYMWNRPEVAHSEQELDQYFRDFKASKGKNVEVTVKRIFSERQFCGPSGQDCERLIYKSYPEAEKEFAYNYQMPPGIPKGRGKGPTTKNVVKDRIEAFRDSDEAVDTSTRRDPPPYSERAGGRLPGQVAPPPPEEQAGDRPEAQVPAKPATPAKSTTPATATTEAPAKPAAPEKPATPAKSTTPATATTEAPAKPAAPAKPVAPATATTEAPAPAKPATPAKAKTQTPAKPSVSESAQAKPSRSKPTSSTPSRTTPSGDVSGPQGEGGHGGSKTTAVTEHIGNAATGVLLGQTMNQLKNLAERSGDKDLASAIDTLNKGMDVKNFVEDPQGYIAGKVKEKLIQGVFDEFTKSLNTAYQSFEQKFPDVSTLERDPLGTGVSLEVYRMNYEKTLSALRIPDARRALVYTLMLADLPKDAPKEEADRRIAAANQYLATLPGLDVYYREYHEASAQYGLALFVVENQLLVRGDEWAKQPAGLADDLGRRAEALDKVAKALDDDANKLWESGAIVFDPVTSLWQDLDTLSHGFEGLSSRLRAFADEVGRRSGEYDREITRLRAESDKKTAQSF